MAIKRHLKNNKVKDVKFFKKADIIYISTLFLLILAVSISIIFNINQTSDIVVIQVDNVTYGEYDLYENRRIDIEQIGKNTVIIEDGEVFMHSADCRDGLCLKQSKISTNMGTIICLPNRTVVYIKSEEKTDIDVVVK